MGQFIFYDSDGNLFKRSLHLYVLHTWESSQTIISDYRSESTLTAALSTLLCEKFRSNLQALYHNPHFTRILPEPLSPSTVPRLAELIIYEHHQHGPAESLTKKAKLLELSQTMNFACFIISKLQKSRN